MSRRFLPIILVTVALITGCGGAFGWSVLDPTTARCSAETDQQHRTCGIEALVQSLGDSDPEVNHASMTALEMAGSEAQPHLVHALADPLLAEAAADALMHMGPLEEEIVLQLEAMAVGKDPEAGRLASLVIDAMDSPVPPEPSPTPEPFEGLILYGSPSGQEACSELESADVATAWFAYNALLEQLHTGEYGISRMVGALLGGQHGHTRRFAALLLGKALEAEAEPAASGPEADSPPPAPTELTVIDDSCNVVITKYSTAMFCMVRNDGSSFDGGVIGAVITDIFGNELDRSRGFVSDLAPGQAKPVSLFFMSVVDPESVARVWIDRSSGEGNQGEEFLLFEGVSVITTYQYPKVVGEVINTGTEKLSFTLHASFLDEEGHLLGVSVCNPTSGVAPQQRKPFDCHSMYKVDGTHEVVVSVAIMNPPLPSSVTDPEPSGLVVLANTVNVVTTQYSTVVFCVIENGGEAPNGASLKASFTDEGGAIVGTANGFVADLDPGASKPVQLYSSTPVPESSAVSVMIDHVWGIGNSGREDISFEQLSVEHKYGFPEVTAKATNQGDVSRSFIPYATFADADGKLIGYAICEGVVDLKPGMSEQFKCTASLKVDSYDSIDLGVNVIQK